MKFVRFTYLLPLMLIAGCVSHSTSDAVTTIDPDTAKGSHVQDVHVIGTSPDMPANFADIFKDQILKRMSICAKGPKPLTLNANITEFHIRNIAKTWLVGDSNTIAGTATLVDPVTGATVGDYDIKYSIGGGGLVAAAGMSDAPANLSDRFGSALCKKAFGAQ